MQVHGYKIAFAYDTNFPNFCIEALSAQCLKNAFDIFNIPMIRLVNSCNGSYVKTFVFLD